VLRARSVPSQRARPRERGFQLALVAPSIFVLLLFGVLPLVYLIVVSVQNITMIDVDQSFHGLLNYRLLAADRRLWEALLHTGIFTAIALPVELVLGLAMAQLFIEHIPGRGVFVALLVRPRGAGEPAAILWTIRPDLVYVAILMAEIWQWTPFMFLLLLAALSGVDKSQLEAASIDGAGYWRTFRKIVLPAIRPVMVVAILIRALDLVRLFDIVWALTKGGPGTMTETLSVFTYVKGFQQFETSYTAAVALLVIVLLSVAVFAALKRVELAR